MSDARNKRRLERKRAGKAMKRSLTERPCHGCTECCTALEVPELGKPAWVRCPHVCETGCAIYADRPGSCRAYCCAYRYGLPGVEVRPDVSGVVIDARVPTANIGVRSVLVVREVRPGAGEEFKPTLRHWAQRSLASVLVTKEGGRTFFGPPSVCEQVERYIADHPITKTARSLESRDREQKP